MFDDKEPEDIFSAAEPNQPGAPSPVVQPSTPNQASRPVAEAYLPAEDVIASGPSRTLIIAAVIGVVALLVIGGLVIALWTSRQQSATPTTQQPVVTQPITETNLPVVPLPVETEPEPVVPADTDADGLSDAEEATLGTNPTLVDSDEDGLSDTEEVRVWRTDPLDADTDNDGFPDGTEVDAGYDPNQAGAKLLTIPENTNPGSSSTQNEPVAEQPATPS